MLLDFSNCSRLIKVRSKDNIGVYRIIKHFKIKIILDYVVKIRLDQANLISFQKIKLLNRILQQLIIKDTGFDILVHKLKSII